MFEEAGVEPPVWMKEFYTAQTAWHEQGRLTKGLTGRLFPEHRVADDSVILSRNVYRFWKPEVRLQKEIKDLEDQVLYASSWIDEWLGETKDVAQVAFWFFSFQRRLQRKVVSDFAGTAFLAKTEGRTLYQNNLAVRSGFENLLAKMAGQSGTDTPVIGDSTLALIDRTCLLMKRYVYVYGQGKKENLVFRKGASGGSGRGPVDEYNLLCDILEQLKDRAKDEGIEMSLVQCISFWRRISCIGIMLGKIPGWKLWLSGIKINQ
jgi:hypothetical protein